LAWEDRKAKFTALLRHESLRELPMIMETPVDEKRSDGDNLNVLLDLLR